MNGTDSETKYGEICRKSRFCVGSSAGIAAGILMEGNLLDKGVKEFFAAV
jgi:hypothetical protein